MLVWVMLGSSPGTAAYLSTTFADAGNVVATAKTFTISDANVVPLPGGSLQLSWSAASWAAGGYSIRRATTPTGPFSQVGTVASGVTAYVDSAIVDATSYSYEVFGLSGSGGTGTGSTIASATADATSPTVTATSPSSGTTGVGTDATIAVAFSEAMNQSLTASSLALVDCGPGDTCTPSSVSVQTTLGWSSTSGATLDPTAPLSATNWYAVRLTTSATDLSGNALNCSGASTTSQSSCFWSFQTGAQSGAAGLASMSPANAASGVPTNAQLSFQWTAPLSATAQSEAQAGFSLEQVSGTGSPCFVYGGGVQTPCAVQGGTWANPFADSSTFAPSAPLLSGTTYTVAESASDASNLTVSATATWTTAGSSDTTPPTVTRVSPSDAASGISPSTPVQVTFSEAMNLSATAHAFQLLPWSNAGSCSGSFGAAVAGSSAWNGPTQLSFYPSAALSASTCYHMSLDSTATDVSGNALAAFSGTNFTVVAGTPPTVSLSTGTYYHPGAQVTASGTGWSLGSGNVQVAWDDGTLLDSTGATLVSDAFSGYTFSLPANASNGSHTLWFTRSGGASVGVGISVQAPSSISLSASSTDISAGGQTTIVATAYDSGEPAANALLSFAITTDAGSRGSFVSGGPRQISASQLTNGSGQVSGVTLYVSSGGSFTPITVTVTSGSASQSITIVDPAPLPPASVQLSGTDHSLTVSWLASPSQQVSGYTVLRGAQSGGPYDLNVDAGDTTQYTFTDVVPGQTYYVVVRASDAHGALSDPSAEVHLTVPQATSTPTATATSTATVASTATATASATATAAATATATRTPTAVAMATQVPTHTLTAAPTASATATPVATATDTPTVVATATDTPTVLPTATATATPTAVASATATASTTVTVTATATWTATPIATATATATSSPTSTVVRTHTPTLTPTPPATATIAPSATPTPTH